MASRTHFDDLTNFSLSNWIERQPIEFFVIIFDEITDIKYKQEFNESILFLSIHLMHALLHTSSSKYLFLIYSLG